MTNIAQLIRSIRIKENKSETEELLIQYHRTLSTICEYLVEESKEHLEPKVAILKIRECLKE